MTRQVVVRWALTALLLLGVYSETGKWTALSLLLTNIALEIAGARLNRLLKNPLIRILERKK